MAEPSIGVITSAIENGSFPDSEDALTASLTATTISPLLQSINDSRTELRARIKDISKHQAGDVETWIAQAKKVQEDIARCKEDARQIIQGHERIGSLRATRNEARSKVSLLQDEIVFNEALQEQIHLIAETSTALAAIDNDVRKYRFLQAAQSLPGLSKTIDSISSAQSKMLLKQMQEDLFQDLSKRLRQDLDQKIRIRKEGQTIELSITSASASSDGGRHKEDDTDNQAALPRVLGSLDLLGEHEATQKYIADRLSSVLLPHLHKKSKLKLFTGQIDGSAFRIALSENAPTATELILCIRAFFTYIQDRYPLEQRGTLLEELARMTIPMIVVNWLDSAIPLELDGLSALDELQSEVQLLATLLSRDASHEARLLQSWLNQTPKTWIAKRRMASLDAVRRAFNQATAVMREVERVERHTLAAEQAPSQAEHVGDEWSDAWEEDEQTTNVISNTSGITGDDGSDAWGFDTDDPGSEGHNKDETSNAVAANDDDGDAWGWGEDEETKAAANPAVNTTKPTKLNRSKQLHIKEHEIVLKETFNITDIPDLLIQQISKDRKDLETLKASPKTYFPSSSNVTAEASDFESLPSLILAMYRATAPTFYTASSTSNPPLSNMHLYNDAMYLGQALCDAVVPPLRSLQIDLDTLARFGRQIYTTELSTQRTILTDLLDTSQGFISCTREPYASACETAVSSTTDYLRSLHGNWQKILGTSHLHQSVGSLLSSVMSKMVKDIEDMEDISEPESQKLVEFCERVSELQNLFLASPPPGNGAEGDKGPVTTVALHVPVWFRFQQLQEILKANLIDIRYMWEEADLSSDFSADEVVDLIKALFAESSHRRTAISAIKARPRRG